MGVVEEPRLTDRVLRGSYQGGDDYSSTIIDLQSGLGFDQLPAWGQKAHEDPLMINTSKGKETCGKTGHDLDRPQ